MPSEPELYWAFFFCRGHAQRCGLEFLWLPQEVKTIAELHHSGARLRLTQIRTTCRMAVRAHEEGIGHERGAGFQAGAVEAHAALRSLSFDAPPAAADADAAFAHYVARVSERPALKARRPQDNAARPGLAACRAYVRLWQKLKREGLTGADLRGYVFLKERARSASAQIAAWAESDILSE